MIGLLILLTLIWSELEHKPKINENCMSFKRLHLGRLSIFVTLCLLHQLDLDNWNKLLDGIIVLGAIIYLKSGKSQISCKSLYRYMYLF